MPLADKAPTYLVGTPTVPSRYYRVKGSPGTYSEYVPSEGSVLTVDYALLGQRISKALDDAGLSGTEASVRMGYASNAVSRWITGSRRPAIDDLFKLSLVTGKPVSWLLDLADEDGRPTRAERLLEELNAKAEELTRNAAMQDLSPEQGEILDASRHLSPDGVRKLLDFARFLLTQERGA